MKKLTSCKVALEGPTNGASTHIAEALHNGDHGRQELAEVRLPNVVVGRIVVIGESGVPLVDFLGNTSGELVYARSLVPITGTEAGQEVALVFEDGDLAKPIVAGILQAQESATAPREVKLDGDSLVLIAKREVVIQCGKASITLTSAGKVLIQGEYVLSRSTGVNKIRGGSIQLN